jgi:hypothetical protein
MKASLPITSCLVAMVCSLPSSALAFTVSSQQVSRSESTIRHCNPTSQQLPESSSRRTLLTTIATTSLTTLLPLPPALATDNNDLLTDLSTSLDKLSTIPPLLEQAEWDKVRTILKTPPVNTLWNLGDSTNPLVKLAKSTSNMELLELKDDLSISLQMTDQYSYDNVFIYYQPGNGKVKVKEPMEMCKKAIGQLREAIDVAKGSL